MPRIGIDTFTGRTFSLDVRRMGQASQIVDVEFADENQGLRIVPDVELIVPQDERDKRGKRGDEEE
jgi:hypothetical protein